MSKKRKNKIVAKYSADDIKWVEESALRMGGVVRKNSDTDVKVSEVVKEFAAPLLDVFAETDEDCLAVMDVACILWNMALTKNAGKADTYKKAEDALVLLLWKEPFCLAPDGALNCIQDMIKCKNEHFAWCDRLIIDKKMEVDDVGLKFLVISAPCRQHRHVAEGECAG